MASDRQSKVTQRATPWIVLALTLLALLVNAWGIRKDLPYIPENDERKFVWAAVRIAASGSANPGWFGHPGSTVIYPAAGAYRVLHGSNAQAAFDADFSQFYLIGRIVAVLYATLSVPLIYLVGRKAFGAKAGLIGAWLCIFNPLILWHTQVVRTDSAAMFFGMLSLWRILEAYDRPSARNQVLAGVAIGLSISSRYLMGILVLPLLVVDLALLRQATGKRKGVVTSAIAGLAALGAAFALSTPYLFLDFWNALRSVRSETRRASLGADGLTPPGNLLWYLTQALPSALTWPQYALALVGVVLAAVRRRFRQLLLVGYAAAFVAIISLSYLHWDRWLIPILPILMILAGDVLVSACRRVFTATRPQMILLGICVVAITAWPAREVILHDYRESHPSTRVLARAWMTEHIPAHSRIVQEWYTAALAGTDFAVTEKFSLAEYPTPEQYRQEGYDYLVASDTVYGRYFAEADRYPERVKFYNALFACDCLVQEFKPSPTQGGSTIRIYRLGAAAP
jgi:4-amino-4-deoxy-L-arabinose transferase-like glycosyltransferase